MDSIQYNRLRRLELAIEDEKETILKECGWSIVKDRPTSPAYWEKLLSESLRGRWTAPDVDCAIRLEKFDLDLGSIG